MTMHRLALSAASVQKTVAVAALVLAATGLAAGTASAADNTNRPLLPCSDGSERLPGETAAVGGPTHQGRPTVKVSGEGRATVSGDTATYHVRITLTNRTGADYQHVSALPAMFTQLGVMNLQNTKVTLVHDGAVTPLPLRPGCDPTFFPFSAALDTPLANGASAHFDLDVSTPLAVAQKIKKLSVSSYAAADGDLVVLESNVLDLPAVAPAPTPTRTAEPTPTVAPTPTAAPTTAAPVVQAAAASPVPSASAAEPAATLASTGGGGSTGVLAVGAAALIAVGAALLFVLKRRSRNDS